MKPNIGIGDQDREAVVHILDEVLADEYVLLTKTRNFHWNLVGKGFTDLHKFLDGQYEALNGIVDAVAERTRQLGGLALGSLAEFLGHSRLKEQRRRTIEERDASTQLLKDHESLVVLLRENVNECGDKHHDAGTCGFLTELMLKHEKMAWMWRSLLEGQAALALNRRGDWEVPGLNGDHHVPIPPVA